MARTPLAAALLLILSAAPVFADIECPTPFINTWNNTNPPLVAHFWHHLQAKKMSSAGAWAKLTAEQRCALYTQHIVDANAAYREFQEVIVKTDPRTSKTITDPEARMADLKAKKALLDEKGKVILANLDSKPVPQYRMDLDDQDRFLQKMMASTESSLKTKKAAGQLAKKKDTGTTATATKLKGMQSADAGKQQAELGKIYEKGRDGKELKAAASGVPGAAVTGAAEGAPALAAKNSKFDSAADSKAPPPLDSKPAGEKKSGGFMDFLKEHWMPIVGALGGALIGGLMGGGKGALIGLAAGGALGLGGELLTKNSKPKNEYEKTIDANSGALAANSKEGQGLAGEATKWSTDLNQARRDRTDAEAELKGGVGSDGKPVRNLKEQREDLFSKYNKGEVSREDYFDGLKSIDKKETSLKEKIDDANRREAGLDAKRPEMEEKIKRYQALEIQSKKLREDNAEAGRNLDEFKKANTLHESAGQKADEAKSLRGKAEAAEKSLGQATSFEDRKRRQDEAAKMRSQAEALEKEAKANEAASQAIFNRGGPVPDPLKDQQAAAKMKRAEVLNSPKYELSKDKEAVKRYTDCDPAKEAVGADCSFGKASLDLEKRAKPGSREAEASKTLAWCAKQRELGSANLDGCDKAMLYYRAGEKRPLPAQVPRQRGLMGMISADCVWFQDSAGRTITHKVNNPNGSAIWGCSGGKAEYLGSAVDSQSCSVSTCP